MKLSVLFSTIDEGIERIGPILLARRRNVDYFVVHQFRDRSYARTPQALCRGDLRIVHMSGAGLTRSRNTALAGAGGEVALFADDDVRYEPEDFITVQETFRDHPDLDVAIFRIRTPAGSPEYKRYPPTERRLEKLPFSVSTIEIAVRAERVRAAGIRFDERFGAGNPFLIGSEESIFVMDCIRAGLQVMYFPHYVVEHPPESTTRGIPPYDSRRNRVLGGYDARVNGPVAILKAFAGTATSWRKIRAHGRSPLRYLFDRLSAALYVLVTSPARS